MADLKNATAGDTVVVSYGWSGRRLAKVERTTRTQVVIAGIKYNRSGNCVGADRWSSNIAWMPEDSEIDEIREEIERNELLREIGNMSLKKLQTVPTDSLRKMLAIYTEATDETS